MVTIKNLTFGYRAKRLLFEELNLTLHAGHIYGILGKNGAGKSTLLKLMAGLAYAKHGEISVIGNNPTLRQPIFLQQVCFVPEEFYLPPVGTKAFIKTNSAFYPDFDEPYFKSLLSQFDIPEGQKLLDMSYGQKKKFIIAFGLATKAKLLIMDEPTNGLDIPSKTQFRKIMASAVDGERCIIISTHQVRDLDNLIDTVIVLDENKIALNAPVDFLTEKLLFTKQKEVNEKTIYAEPGLTGHHVILPNYHAEDSHLDMELLFNAILQDKQKLTAYLN